MRAIRTACLGLLVALTCTAVARAADEVDLLLVLAADVSRSVDAAKVPAAAQRLRLRHQQSARA